MAEAHDLLLQVGYDFRAEIVKLEVVQLVSQLLLDQVLVDIGGSLRYFWAVIIEQAGLWVGEIAVQVFHAVIVDVEDLLLSVSGLHLVKKGCNLAV